MQAQTSVSIFWDYECCPGHSSTESSLNGYEIVHKIRTLAHRYGSVKSFKLYLDSPLPPENAILEPSFRSQLQISGVGINEYNLNDTTTGSPKISNQMMNVDIVVHAIDHSAPSTVILLTGKNNTPGLSYAVSALRARKYDVVVICPSVSELAIGLRTQASSIFQWNKDIIGTAKLNGFALASGQLKTPPLQKSAPAENSTTRRGASVAGFDQLASLPKSPEVLYHSPPQSDENTACRHTRNVPSITLNNSDDDFVRPESLNLGKDRNLQSTIGSWRNSTPFGRNETTLLPSLNPFTTRTYPPGVIAPPKPFTPYFATNIGPSKPATVDTSPTRSATFPSRFPRPNSEVFFSTDHELARNSASTSSVLASPFHHSSASSISSDSLTFRPPSPLHPDEEQRASITDTSDTATQRRETPSHFRPLISVLQSNHEQGVSRPLRSAIGLQLTRYESKQGAGIYRKAGVESFKQYAALAEREGVITLGGKDGNAWIALNLQWQK